MNPTPHNDPATDSVEQQAAAWVLRTDRGLTGAEQDNFLQWLAADRRHGAALARHKRNWDRLNRLGQWLPEHSLQPNRDLLAPSPSADVLNAGPSRSRFRMSALSSSKGLAGSRAWLAPLAIAAALAVGFFAWRARPLPVTADATPAIASIVSRTLEDGSVIELNRGAVISVLFTPGERRVQLEKGEAHFTVAKNQDRPFVVSAAGVDVRAVGTAFNVRLDAAAVDVLVTEGVVQVGEQGAGSGERGARSSESAFSFQSLHLSAGERTRVSLVEGADSPRALPTTPEQAERLLAWQPRILDFTATPLLGVVSDFNRHNAPIRLVVEDLDLARTEVSASLRSDNVEGFIRLLEAGFGVRADRDGDTITLRKAP